MIDSIPNEMGENENERKGLKPTEYHCIFPETHAQQWDVTCDDIYIDNSNSTTPHRQYTI